MRNPDPEERGLHVHDEGSRSQHPERSCWCRCACWLRQVPGHVHQLETGAISPSTPPGPFSLNGDILTPRKVIIFDRNVFQKVISKRQHHVSTNVVFSRV